MSAPAGRRLNLNLFIYPGGHHEAAWRYSGSAPRRVLDITYYQELARRAEAAKLDAIFLADGALVIDPASGVFADTEKIHPIDHEGERLRVRGPLNTPRGPQGRPVYVQAGPPRTAGPSPPRTPRRSSPRTRPSATPATSTPTSSPGSRPRAATPTR
ncbi:hypothetical protein [Spongiactinospora sp. TRM90649]|uniref:hypothetical protein n=1 Tax=Spongiactinospora sp. TRM90649 TaxID=3031114 RepID=UPI0023F9815F|nr:hypothetical protein [Spongiactinospora sp. TRM90649]MDF5752464.1 hypothetical protein [Spongiactinospora sp. TRM90649]